MTSLMAAIIKGQKFKVKCYHHLAWAVKSVRISNIPETGNIRLKNRCQHTMKCDVYYNFFFLKNMFQNVKHKTAREILKIQKCSQSFQNSKYSKYKFQK